ncbi:hypothetical protein PIB30_060740 [Stylosanthes scabra]|uniref:Uncharacterized protein n=1 Tax=Stylosanthes scabra TaxID=79078 RepID=A0ABU6SL27_9FABA|nr:hypothetical protein [Stylosanthes scabra]
MAYNWSFHILDWVKDAIADFQHNGVKHISGCMYALLEILAKLRRQLIMDIVLTPFNTKRDDVLKMIFPHLQGRSILKRGKKKEVENPYIAPNTREITRRAEEGKGIGRGKNNEKGK